MTKHASHMWMCGAMIAFALVALVVSGNPVVLIPALGCLLMMGAMMFMMMRMTGGGGRSDGKGS